MQIAIGISLGLLVAIILLSILCIKQCRKGHLIRRKSTKSPGMPFISNERHPRTENTGRYLNRNMVGTLCSEILLGFEELK